MGIRKAAQSAEGAMRVMRVNAGDVDAGEKCSRYKRSRSLVI